MLAIQALCWSVFSVELLLTYFWSTRPSRVLLETFLRQTSTASGSARQGFILSSFSAAQRCPGRGENILPRIGATVANPDAAGGDAHLRGDFQQLQPDSVGLGFRPLRARQAQPSQGLDQHISQRGKVQAQLIGPQRLCAHPVREQAQLLLDAILHFTSRAVELLIEFLRRPGFFTERSD